MSKIEQENVFQELSKINCRYKLLYLTPEKISQFGKINNILKFLYLNKKLAIFAIDEAHCVSEWGHDFRPAYKQLRNLRTNYPNVPIIAVTATATAKVKDDVLLQLGMKDCKW